MNTIAFGRTLDDAQLAEFHGGACSVYIDRDANGNVTGVRTVGDCGNVNVVVQA